MSLKDGPYCRNFIETYFSPIVHRGRKRNADDDDDDDDDNGCPQLFETKGVVDRIKRTEPIVYREIKRLNSMGIAGVIAGGYAAFIMGLTTEYTDVDYFCENVEAVDYLCTYDPTFRKNFFNIYEERWRRKRQRRLAATTVVVNSTICKLQVIGKIKPNDDDDDDDDDYNILNFGNIDCRRYRYYTELIRNFDLEVCRKGIFLCSPSIVRNCAITGDYSDESIEYIYLNRSRRPLADKDDPLPERVKKYRKRFKSYGSPMTLQEICQDFILFT